MPLPEHSEDSKCIVQSTHAPFEYPNISAGEYLAGRIAKHDPNLFAFLDPDNEFRPTTYGQLHLQIQQFASGLLELGVRKDDFVIYFADNSLQYSTAWFASLYLGLTLCSVPPPSGPFEFAHQVTETRGIVLIFGSSKASVIHRVLNNQQYRDCMGQFRLIVQLQCEKVDEILLSDPLIKGQQIKVHTFDEVAKLGNEKRLDRIPHFPVEDPKRKHFAIFYTSGTTGKPKGVIHTHWSYVATLINLQYPSNHYAKRIVLPYPLGHLSGSVFMPQALDRGMTVLHFQNATIDTIMAAIDKCRVNYYIFSANAAAPLANAGYEQKYDLTCLEGFRYGGSKIAGNLLQTIKQKYQVRMVEVFGATEFLGAVGVEDSDAWENFVSGNVGNVLQNVEMKIADLENGKALPANQNGEICLRGGPCFVGYLNNPGETANAIDPDGWYHSGDVGYYDERRCLYLTDRIKEVIKYKFNGIVYSIFPAEIEADIARHSAVESICVVGVPHLNDGYLVRAYVQVKEGKELTEQELIDYLKENVGSHKWLRGGVRFVAEMPRTVVGKVDRQYFKVLVKNELITDPAAF